VQKVHQAFVWWLLINLKDYRFLWHPAPAAHKGFQYPAEIPVRTGSSPNHRQKSDYCLSYISATDQAISGPWTGS